MSPLSIFSVSPLLCSPLLLYSPCRALLHPCRCRHCPFLLLSIFLPSRVVSCPRNLFSAVRQRSSLFFFLSASAAVGETASGGELSEGSRPPLIPNQPFLSAVPHSPLCLLISQVQWRGVVVCDGGGEGVRLTEAKWRRRNLQSVETKEAFFL